MRQRFDVWCSVVVIFGLGCAEGAAAPSEFSGGDFGLGTSDAAISAAPPPRDAGAMTPAMTGPTMPPPFTGSACMMGEQKDCTCADGVSMGMQSCHFDAASPTKGALGSCDKCKAPAVPDAGMPEAGSGAAGSSSAGSGSAGSSAAGSGGSRGAGSGGSMAAGSGGSAGSAAMCVADKCPDPGRDLLGIPLRKCCTRRGECGGQSLLSGCSTQ
jgi:hypothetical protein